MNDLNFFEDFRQNLISQYEKCPAYRLICATQNYNTLDELKKEQDIEKIPFIATTLFKKSANLFPKLLRTKIENIDKWTVSSSTRGDPSIVGRKKTDILKIKEIANLDRKILDPDCDYNCVFYPKPEIMRKYNSEKILGKPTESYIGNVLNIFPFNKNTIFLLKLNKNQFDIDIDAFKRFIREHDKKNHHLSVRGSTLLLFNAVEYLKDKMKSVNLGDKAIVHTGGGGWDGSKGTINIGTKIPRWKFVKQVSEFLGIPEENFIDTYSFTENSLPITGGYSEKYKDYLFNVPKWERIIIRDMKTLKPLHNKSDRGFIQVLNAYGTSTFAGASVLVDDIAEIVSEKSKNRDMTIKIIGRVKGAEAKGCGATLNIRRADNEN